MGNEFLMGFMNNQAGRDGEAPRWLRCVKVVVWYPAARGDYERCRKIIQYIEIRCQPNGAGDNQIQSVLSGTNIDVG